MIFLSLITIWNQYRLSNSVITSVSLCQHQCWFRPEAGAASWCQGGLRHSVRTHTRTYTPTQCRAAQCQETGVYWGKNPSLPSTEWEIVWIPITLFRRQLVNLFSHNRLWKGKRQPEGGLMRKSSGAWNGGKEFKIHKAQDSFRHLWAFRLLDYLGDWADWVRNVSELRLLFVSAEHIWRMCSLLRQEVCAILCGNSSPLVLQTRFIDFAGTDMFHSHVHGSIKVPIIALNWQPCLPI